MANSELVLGSKGFVETDWIDILSYSGGGTDDYCKIKRYGNLIIVNAYVTNITTNGWLTIGNIPQEFIPSERGNLNTLNFPITAVVSSAFIGGCVSSLNVNTGDLRVALATASSSTVGRAYVYYTYILN